MTEEFGNPSGARSGAPSGAREVVRAPLGFLDDGNRPKSPKINKLCSGASLATRVTDRLLGTRSPRLLTQAASVPSKLSGCKGENAENGQKSAIPDLKELIAEAKSAGRAHHFVVVGVWAALTGRVTDRKSYRRWMGVSLPVRQGLIETFAEGNLPWFRSLCEALGRRER